MDIIAKYFNDLSKIQVSQFGKLFELYNYWNTRINVISRKDINNLYINHILHSLSIAKIIKFTNKTTIMDVGTGGGLPGIPLAIYFPEVQFYLIDSIGKKINVVKNISKKLNLQNIRADKIRVEEVKEKFDFIISRAVTSLPKFISLVKNKIKPKSNNELPNGILYLKGADYSKEIKQISKEYKAFSISEIFEEIYFETKYIIHIKLN